MSDSLSWQYVAGVHPVDADGARQPPVDYPLGDHERAAIEAAESNRLNSAHWSPAVDQHINATISEHGNTVRVRSNHEYWNNASVEGLVHQHTIAVAGESGPIVDIIVEDENFERWGIEAEALIEEWSGDGYSRGMSDAGGRLSLGARIKQWNSSCWRNGEWLDQLVYPSNAQGPVKLRLHSIETNRLCTPTTSQAADDVVLGVRRDELRNPLEYWISDDWGAGMAGDWYPSDFLIHGYEQIDAGQARGLAWSQTGLPIAADVRDYDDQVMDAARSMADQALVAHTKHPDAEYRALTKDEKTVRIRRRQINHLAPGWELSPTHATQPAAQYKEHRQERRGDLGLGKGVPSMMVRLDARDHNYSSARFDRGNLHESAKHVRATIYNPEIVWLFRLVIAEGILARAIGPAPRRYRIELIWPPMPQIDEDKSSRAEERYLSNGTLSYDAACKLRHGRRARDVIRQRARDARALEESGLPAIGGGERSAAGTLADELVNRLSGDG